jgi:hypothetical protein
MMEEIGTIYRDGREIYLIIDADNEAYYFDGGSFHQGLTRFATKGCKVTDILDLIPSESDEEKEGLK